MSLLKRAFETTRDHGPRELVRRGLAWVYLNGARRLLPRVGPVRYAGIPIGLDWRWGDRRVPRNWRPSDIEDIPDYEAALVDGLSRSVRPGDRVVVVGGGLGVTAVVAATKTGPSGIVYCYEGAAEGVEVIRRTAERNHVAERLVVYHAVVGTETHIWGTAPTTDVFAAEDLPECDVLELDCEGAEAVILQRLTSQPRVIVVETHGVYGASTSSISELLEDRGYHVDPPQIAEPRHKAVCEAKDIRVLVGWRRELPMDEDR